MSAAEAQEVKNLLLRSNEQYRELAERHHQLDDRLHELTEKHYLSDTEQFEEVTTQEAKARAEGPDGSHGAGLQFALRPRVVAPCLRILSHAGLSRPVPTRDNSTRFLLCASTPQAGRSSSVGWWSRSWRRSSPARSTASSFSDSPRFLPVFLPRPRAARSTHRMRRCCRRPMAGSCWPGRRRRVDFRPRQWQQISIFLSPMDVHINRMPVGGTIVKVAYHPGRFMPAFKAEAGDLNEFTEVTVDHGGQTIVVPADRRHPGATHRLSREAGRPGPGRRSDGRDEIRLPDGRVPAAVRGHSHDGERQGRWRAHGDRDAAG